MAAHLEDHVGGLGEPPGLAEGGHHPPHDLVRHREAPPRDEGGGRGDVEPHEAAQVRARREAAEQRQRRRGARGVRHGGEGRDGVVGGERAGVAGGGTIEGSIRRRRRRWGGDSGGGEWWEVGEKAAAAEEEEAMAMRWPEAEAEASLVYSLSLSLSRGHCGLRGEEENVAGIGFCSVQFHVAF